MSPYCTRTRLQNLKSFCVGSTCNVYYVLRCDGPVTSHCTLRILFESIIQVPGLCRASMSSQPKSSLLDVFLRTWYLGFTSFGGPVVHFQIFHRMFVEGQNSWLDEQTVRYLPSAFSFFWVLMVLLHSFRSFLPFVRPFQVQAARRWDSA